MHFANQVLAFFTVFLFASAGVEAGCSILGPGTEGYGGSIDPKKACIGRRKVLCPLADDGGGNIRCCDDASCT
ncbi:hypothetical protein CMUS01_16325 [Colletotrichum musicola]|uniref:Uncharacterized protein n=1 Tax=Colletotrichum musicola TaxID=2175873 RepID=A0A8H6IQ28_9PEZI|nr:hypothetical protein CMUS01_16325 [Colletotrichum musicola]